MIRSHVARRRHGSSLVAQVGLGLIVGAGIVLPGCASHRSPVAPSLGAAEPVLADWNSGDVLMSAWAEVEPIRIAPDALDIWRTDTFQRRFTDSYLSVSELEPTPGRRQRDRLEDMRDRLADDDVAGAIQLIERELRSNPDDALYNMTIANLLVEQNRSDEAVPYFERAIERFPKFRRAHRNLAIIHVRSKPERFAAAIPHLIQTIALGGGDEIIYGLLGYAYEQSNDSVASESAYRMAVMLGPNTQDWKMGLLRTLFAQTRYREAVAYADELLAAQPSNADLWMFQANAFIGLEEPMRAAENFELIDQIGGSTVDTLTTLGDIYVIEGLFGAAVDAYDRALGVDAETAMDRAIRAGRILASRRAYDDTARLIDRIQATGRADAATRSELQRLRARIIEADGTPEQAIALLETMVAEDPLDAQALIQLGEMRSKLPTDSEEELGHQRALAQQAFERAAGVEGFERSAKLALAGLKVKQKQYDDAVTLLKRVQQIESEERVQRFLEEVERLRRAG